MLMSKNRQFNYLGVREASGCTNNPKSKSTGTKVNSESRLQSNCRGGGRSDWANLKAFD